VPGTVETAPPSGGNSAALLRLPEVQHFVAVGFLMVVGVADRLAGVAPFAAEEVRNVILRDAEVLALIEEARAYGKEFGLLVEVAAITGARVSQIRRLEIQDLLLGKAPRLIMPASRKGKGIKKVMRRTVPISVGLAARLAAAVEGQTPTAPFAGQAEWRTLEEVGPLKPVRPCCEECRA